MTSREGRQYPPHKKDPRSDFQRDRDRLLYSGYLRRLAGVTQVVSAAEGEVFHNRLTHSLKVAQLGRRIAEYMLSTSGDESLRDSLDPEVVEAAGLAHDIGHPPFGHIAEEELNRAVSMDTDKRCGYEGNAQGYRILVRLDHSDDVDSGHANPWDESARCPGLNLTKATLNATLKYPWTYQARGDRKKWGAYDEDAAEFTWTRDGASEKRTIEAEIMDWADDVTFAVHDTEDFYRAGLIPLHRLFTEYPDDSEIEYLLAPSRCQKLVRRALGLRDEEDAAAATKEVLGRIAEAFPPGLAQPHRLDSRAIRQIHCVSSMLIQNFVRDGTVEQENGRWQFTPDAASKQQVEFLKVLTWRYVILNDALATQQAGQRKVVSTLYSRYRDAIVEDATWLVPRRFHGCLEHRSGIKLPPRSMGHLDGGIGFLSGASTGKDQDAACRAAADIVASLTEREAMAQYQQMEGLTAGSGVRGHI